MRDIISHNLKLIHGLNKKNFKRENRKTVVLIDKRVVVVVPPKLITNE